MDLIIEEIVEKIDKLIKYFKTSPKRKYINFYFIDSLSTLREAINSKGSELKKNLQKVSNSLDEFDKELKSLAEKKFFEIFGGYAIHERYLSKMIEENNHMNSLAINIFSDKAKRSRRYFDLSDLRIIDKIIETQITNNPFMIGKKKSNKITNEFAFIFLGLGFSSENNAALSEEKEEEEKKGGQQPGGKIEYPLNIHSFEELLEKFVDALKLNKHSLLAEERKSEYMFSFKNQEKITRKDLEEFFKTLHPFEDRTLEIRLLKENATIKIKNHYFQVENGEKVPLMESFKMTFGRENPENQRDYSIGTDKSISKKQFELIFLENSSYAVKCLSKANYTNFLISNSLFPLNKFSVFTISDKHAFYVRETEKNPLEHPDEPFLDGPFMTFKGISPGTVYNQRKFMVKTQKSLVDPEKEEYEKVIKIKKSERCKISGDITFPNESIEEGQALIGYDSTKGWFIQSGLSAEKDWIKKSIKVAVTLFDETKEGANCSPKILREGDIICVNDFYVQIIKMK